VYDLFSVLLYHVYYIQGRIYAWAKGARAQGGKFPEATYLKKKKIEIEVWYAEKKAVHEREI
jgi:hypothetical protein